MMIPDRLNIETNKMKLKFKKKIGAERMGEDLPDPFFKCHAPLVQIFGKVEHIAKAQIEIRISLKPDKYGNYLFIILSINI